MIFIKKIDDVEIRDFMPMLYCHEFEDDPDFTLNGRIKEEWRDAKVPKYLLPFAMDWGGNYICYGLNDGIIYYYVRDV